MLQQSRNLAVCWKPYAERALREKGTLTEVEAEIASWKRSSEAASTNGEAACLRAPMHCITG